MSEFGEITVLGLLITATLLILALIVRTLRHPKLLRGSGKKMNEIQRFTEEKATTWMGASGLKVEAITELAQFTHIVARFFRANDENRRWLFRGEGALYESPATPSMLRVDLNTLTRERHPHRSITDQEIEQVEACQRDQRDGYAADAAIHVEMRVDEQIEAGNVKGMYVWKRVLNVIEELISSNFREIAHC